MSVKEKNVCSTCVIKTHSTDARIVTNYTRLFRDQDLPDASLEQEYKEICQASKFNNSVSANQHSSTDLL